ncbi:hypothetical protein RBH20_19585 [Haloarcula sp. H-GB4]|uniref:hypothetical protein n=1 Tax=Haloarcula sp. H-GB4 TaxID=3069755 RepID=UPI0027B21F8E|nr:hypothetical protein [Haloarcula sp. H-GB4]MDQ2074733.1 hypothetical protein [Haloarcula sp. H-GB4]
MPSRRTVLQTGLVTFSTYLAGCTSPITDKNARTPVSYDDSGTFGETPDGPKSYPDRPDSLSPETISSYVREFEYARVYNSLHESDAETVSVDCTGVYDTGARGGHYALAACTGYANYADGGHADHGQGPAVYFVGDRLTVRIEDLDSRHRDYKDVFSAEEPGENVEQPGEGSSTGYRVYNLDTNAHELSVIVDFLGAFTPAEAFSTEYTLGPTSGILQDSVTYRRGEYRITAELANGSSASTQWTVTKDDDYGRHKTSIIVDPAGKLTIRKPPFSKVR